MAACGGIFNLEIISLSKTKKQPIKIAPNKNILSYPLKLKKLFYIYIFKTIKMERKVCNNKASFHNNKKKTVVKQSPQIKRKKFINSNLKICPYCYEMYDRESKFCPNCCLVVVPV